MHTLRFAAAVFLFLSGLLPSSLGIIQLTILCVVVCAPRHIAECHRRGQSAEPRAHDCALAQDLAAAREFAAKYVFKALEYGYKAGFKKGLTHDAKLFGEVAASPSGQEWIRRFIDKDPRQSSFLTILTPG